MEETVTVKKILLSMPPALQEEIDAVVRGNFKNRSEFARAAFRHALDNHYAAQNLRKQLNGQQATAPAPASTAPESAADTETAQTERVP